MSTGDSEGVYRFLFNLKNGNDDDDIISEVCSDSKIDKRKIPHDV